MNTKEKGFSSKLGFLATAASSAVGVGNIWRFPYLTGKYGGGSFVVLYIICVFILGFPLVLSKLAFGRKMKAGTFNAYKPFKPKSWTLIGTGAALTSFLMLSYYIVITGWLIGYLINIGKGGFLSKGDFANEFTNFVGNAKLNIFYTFAMILTITFIIQRGVQNGIERVSKILMPLFIVMLIALIIYCLTLKNIKKGLAFYLLPRLDAFTLEAFHAALTQSFVSLSIGLGISLTYGAYVNKNDNLIKSTFIICISDTLISLFAGLIIFPLIFQANLEPDQGAALIFISLPLAFKSIGPSVGIIIGVVFFLLLVFAALTSAIALLEVLVKHVIERFNISRSKSVFIIGTLICILSIPSILSNGACTFFTNFLKIQGDFMSFLDVADLLSGDLMAPIVAVCFSIFVNKKLKIDNLIAEIGNKESWLKIYLTITIKFVCPILVSSLVIVKLVKLYT